MKRALVFSTSNSFGVGGFADRIKGMATLRSIANSFDADFFIDHASPFDFFDLFPAKRSDHRYAEDRLNRRFLGEINLIDENYSKNIHLLVDFLCSMQTLGCWVRVYINNLQPSYYDFLMRRVLLASPTLSEELELAERTLLQDFGRDFMAVVSPVLEFGVLEMMDRVRSMPTIAVHVRVGGRNSGWIDPDFCFPTEEQVLVQLSRLDVQFKQVFVSSDSQDFKSRLRGRLSQEWDVLDLPLCPQHFERSVDRASDFVSRTLGDHFVMRVCDCGVLTAGGGYGRTAAMLAGHPVYRLETNLDGCTT